MYATLSDISQQLTCVNKHTRQADHKFLASWKGA